MERVVRAALFEINETRLSERISQAEKALALGARDLFQMAGDNIEEGEALGRRRRRAFARIEGDRREAQTQGRWSK